MAHYARQFIAGSSVRAAATLSESQSLGDQLQLRHTPDLSTARRSEGVAEVLVLGQLLDPQHPTRTNAEVVSSLIGRIEDFADFESHSAALAGRWVAFVRIGESWRVYPDACGTRTVFYVCQSDGRLVIGSQPNLFVEFVSVEMDEDVRQRFQAPAHNADSWPLALTPYRHVLQLLPNHYLEVDSGEAVRFWPRDAIDAIEPGLAVDEVERILHNTIEALTRRGSAALPLTGGYDSRTLLACAGDRQQELLLARVTGHHLPFYDTLIPRKLARRIGARVETIQCQKGPADVVKRVADNTGGMWWDPADYMIYSFRFIDSDFLLLGQISEVTRCYYYPDGRHPQRVTPELAAKVTKFGENPLAIAAFSRWLDALPDEAQPITLDLLYWEHRVGNWAANLANALDTFFEPVFPFNCRNLLVAMLGVPVDYRIEPYRLHRMVCSQAEPRFDDTAFNESWLDRWVSAHWRIKRAVANFRRKSSGF